MAEGEKKGMGIYSAHPKVPQLFAPSLNRLVSGNQLERKRRESSSPGLDTWLVGPALRLSPLPPPVPQGSGTTLSVPSETFEFLCPQSVNFRGSADQKGQALESRGFSK